MNAHRLILDVMISVDVIISVDPFDTHNHPNTSTCFNTNNNYESHNSYIIHLITVSLYTVAISSNYVDVSNFEEVLSKLRVQSYIDPRSHELYTVLYDIERQRNVDRVIS